MTSVATPRPLPTWLLRGAWLALPVSAGPAFAAACRDWSDGPRVALEAMLWASWATALLAVVAPRRSLLTAARVIAPTFVVLGVLAALDGAPSTIAKIGAVAGTLLPSALVSGHDLAIAAVNADAYGDEVRMPLRVPPALFAGPLPLARMLVSASVAGPVLLLADQRWVGGAVAIVVAIALLGVLVRALHGLSRRFGVLVPAGFVVVDPLTLADPVLFVRDHVVELAPVGRRDAPPGVLDLRLGATLGSVALCFDEPAELSCNTRRRRSTRIEHSQQVWIALVRSEAFLRTARERRMRVG